MDKIADTLEALKKYINKAHVDGFDTIELPIEKAREIQFFLENNQQESDRITQLENKMDAMTGSMLKLLERIENLPE
jgi:hypothetical protein